MFVSDIVFNSFIQQQCNDEDNEADVNVLSVIALGIILCSSITMFVSSYKKQKKDQIKIDHLLHHQNISEKTISELQGVVKKTKKENRRLNSELKLAEEIFIKTILLIEDN